MIQAAVLNVNSSNLQNIFREQGVIVSNVLSQEMISLDFQKKSIFVPPIYRSPQLDYVFKLLVEKSSSGFSLEQQGLSVIIRTQLGHTILTLWNMQQQQTVAMASLSQVSLSQTKSVLQACGMVEVNRYHCLTLLYNIEELQTVFALCEWRERTTFLYITSFSETFLIEALAKIHISMDVIRYYTYQQLCTLYKVPAI